MGRGGEIYVGRGFPGVRERRAGWEGGIVESELLEPFNQHHLDHRCRKRDFTFSQLQSPLVGYGDFSPVS